MLHVISKSKFKNNVHIWKKNSPRKSQYLANSLAAFFFVFLRETAPNTECFLEGSRAADPLQAPPLNGLP